MVACNMRVMSFNVRGASHADGVNAWDERAAMNVETIRRYGPALIGFQEVHKENLEVYERELPGYARLEGPVYGTDRVEEYAAIFFDPERFEAVDSGGFWLSETPDEYSLSWQKEVVRSANWSRFRCLENDATFLHLNTHLDHVSETARTEGSRLMLRKAEKIGADENLPVIVTGDFNCRPGSPAYRVFEENGFTDTFCAAEEPEDAYTFHAFRGTRFEPGDTDKPTGRIDWILVRGGEGSVEIKAHEILRDGDEEAGTYPSDHYPVLAELTLDG